MVYSEIGEAMEPSVRRWSNFNGSCLKDKYPNSAFTIRPGRTKRVALGIGHRFLANGTVVIRGREHYDAQRAIQRATKPSHEPDLRPRPRLYHRSRASTRFLRPAGRRRRQREHAH